MPGLSPLHGGAARARVAATVGRSYALAGQSPDLGKRVHLSALDHGSMAPVPVLYAIRIYGHLGALVLPAFLALVPQRHGADTVLTNYRNQMTVAHLDGH